MQLKAESLAVYDWHEPPRGIPGPFQFGGLPIPTELATDITGLY